MTRHSPDTARAATARRTRERLLHAGLEILAEERNVKVVALTAARVSAYAGLTPGAFFRHFANHEQFFEELVQSLVHPLAENDPTEARRAMRDALAAGGGPREAIATAALTDQLRARTDAAFITAMILWLQGPRRHEILREQFHRYESGQIATLVELCDRFGWEPRPPCTFATAEALLLALNDGVAIHASADPGFIDDEQYAAAYTALMAILFRPVGDTRDLDDLPAAFGTDVTLADLEANPASG